ncbi:hypothetical protein SASPL_155979 [Salvia splendens]|uniref:Uncharacterized protein n=1 Tax=Salvia splendens TaxID=180675 RepID=A0A8X8VXI0_SALSN|nr:hypothetical protein SASPL_155979 [Salvia splendens]
MTQETEGNTIVVADKEPLAIVPPGCHLKKLNNRRIHDRGRAALHSVGIIRDPATDAGKLSGRIVDSDMNDVGRFLNRILGLSPGIQNRFCSLFDQYYSVFDGHHNSRTDGHLDSGIVDVKANTIEFAGAPKAASSLLEKSKRVILDQVTLDSTNQGENGWENDITLVILVFGIVQLSIQASKLEICIGHWDQEMTLTELKEKYRKLSALEKARTGWEGEYEVSSKQVTIPLTLT